MISVKRLCKIAVRSILFIFLSFWISLFLYKPKYRKNKHFRYIWSDGYVWGIYDGFSRLFTGNNRKVPWPCSPFTVVHHPENIIFDPEDLHIFQTHNVYFQGLNAKTIIGKGTWIAANVGLITCNHDFNDLEKHTAGEDIVIGENCWIGINSTILKGTVLGNRTIVGANSVVTKSFPKGNCVLAGNPAKIIKELENDVDYQADESREKD